MMKSANLNRVINILLLIIIISHISFIHLLQAEYLICTEIDGETAIETYDECDENSDLIKTETEIKSETCQDNPITENCFETEQYFQKTKILQKTFVSDITYITESIKKGYNFIPVVNLLISQNQSVENYATVSLLI